MTTYTACEVWGDSQFSKINSDILNPGNLIFRCDWRRYWNLFSGRGRESPGLTHQVPGRGQYWQTPIKKEVNAHLYWVEVRFRPSVGLLQGLISTRAVIDSTGNQLSTQPVWKANRFALVDVLSCNLVEKGHAFFLKIIPLGSRWLLATSIVWAFSREHLAWSKQCSDTWIVLIRVNLTMAMKAYCLSLGKVI